MVFAATGGRLGFRLAPKLRLGDAIGREVPASQGGVSAAQRIPSHQQPTPACETEFRSQRRSQTPFGNEG